MRSEISNTLRESWQHVPPKRLNSLSYMCNNPQQHGTVQRTYRVPVPPSATHKPFTSKALCSAHVRLSVWPSNSNYTVCRVFIKLGIGGLYKSTSCAITVNELPKFCTDVSGQRIGPIFKGQEVKFLLGLLDPWRWDWRLFRNVCNWDLRLIPLYTAKPCYDLTCYNYVVTY